MKKIWIFFSLLLIPISLLSQSFQNEQNFSSQNQRRVNRLSEDSKSRLRDELHFNLREGHILLSYREARNILFGNLHLQDIGNQFIVKTVYCNEEFSSLEPGLGIGKGQTPDHEIVNTEHIWPQSRFDNSRIKKNQRTRTPPKRKQFQKADLHHLYPSISRTNSIRGNLSFGIVERETKSQICSFGFSGSQSHIEDISLVGFDADGNQVFEPRFMSKGNIARAMFYFSIRYQLNISSTQENILREWHLLDPPSQFEKNRNDKIEAFQGNRNPFIDNPNLVNQIFDF